MIAAHLDHAFDAFRLSRLLLMAVAEAGYETPSQLQQACIPTILSGQDLVVETHAGSGKTLAFALPLLEGLDLSDRLPQVLVLTPSGEEAVRIAEAFQHLARYLPGFHVIPLCGGNSQVVQLRQLERGVHVVIGTPRWTLDHVEKNRLALTDLRTLVLDDADELLRAGFQEDLDALFQLAPAKRQTLVFASDRTRALISLVQQYLVDPVTITQPQVPLKIPALRQRYWQVDAGHKLEALIRLIEIEARFEAALVYVHTPGKAESLTEKLGARGYAVASIHRHTSGRQCDLIAAQLAKRQIDIVIATDAAFQQTDLWRISHVIHYDLPCDTSVYQVRITRAPAAHSILLLVTHHEMGMLHDIEHDIGSAIDPLTLPERPREH
jgi:ATP-dependent RNA helicase DeaD